MIPFFDLKQLNQPYEAQFHAKMDAILKQGWYILGDAVKGFESHFAAYCGTKHAIGVGNGLDALVLILKGYMALGRLQKGDEVIVPANTYIATILAILQADLTPVLVEPDEGTFAIDPTKIAPVISHKTKAILVVHLYGQLADMNAITRLAKANNLLVFEDAAQAHGAALNGKRAGSFGNAAAFSFYPSKNLGCLGDGGTIVTDDDALAIIIRQLSNYGSNEKYKNEWIGVNSRLDEIQAAFLSVKLNDLDTQNETRRQFALRYLREIKNPKIKLPFYDGSTNHVFHLFVIRTEKRNDLKDYLLRHGVETAIHYPIAPHQQKALPLLHHMQLPITESLHQTVLSLPCSPILSEAQISTIITLLNQY